MYIFRISIFYSILFSGLMGAVACDPHNNQQDTQQNETDAGDIIADSPKPIDPPDPQIQEDAGILDSDAGFIENDAGILDSDAGFIDTDAGFTEPDAGILDPDAGLPVEPIEPLPWQHDACGLFSTANQPFTEPLTRWDGQSDFYREQYPFLQGNQKASSAAPNILVTGSSSIRRWEDAFVNLSTWGQVIQRGMGGAHLTDLAALAPQLLDDPWNQNPWHAVVVFAGTNDVDAHTPVDTIVEAYRCFVQRVWEQAGPTPVFYIGITPVPSRTDTWPQADEVNQHIEELTEQHSLLFYVDMPAVFLEMQNQNPQQYANLFVEDQLHLSVAGYQLWNATLQESLQNSVGENFVERDAAQEQEINQQQNLRVPSAGSFVRIDFGPSNVEDGIETPDFTDNPNTDLFGIHWNHWRGARGSQQDAPAGDQQILAGEVLSHLRTTTGAITDAAVVVTGGFRCNGLRNRGLLNPDGARLGTMAVSAATADFFFTGDADDPAGLAVIGLQPFSRHTLRFFASRASTDERRTTEYVITGNTQTNIQTNIQTLRITTTGRDIGSNGYDGNDSVVAVAQHVQADAYGQIYIDVKIAEGRFAYLNLLEIEVER